MKQPPITYREARDSGLAPWGLDLFLFSTTPSVCLIFRDKYPVAPGHLLFVPRDNTATSVQNALAEAYAWGEQLVENNQCDGFNLGINQGVSSGQTIIYPHVHLIPRRFGDCADPTGGIRRVIEGAGNYLNRELNDHQ
jgi:diadenosine tetraphosphate (Ap4A) HIT family hydrolase